MVGVTNLTDETPVFDVKIRVQPFTAFRPSFGIRRKNVTLLKIGCEK
jgi:hypothetical protein